MTKTELIEALADIEHQRWSDWQKHLQENICFTDQTTGTALVIPTHHVDRYWRLIRTPYEDLPSEALKQADRDQVMRYWPLFVEFVAEWMENQNCTEYEGDVQCECSYIANDWRKEMTITPLDPPDHTQ